jgi:hypothetical protein
MATFHTLTVQPWHRASFGERLILEAASALLWPLQPDDRMTVLINLLANETAGIAENEDQIDAIIDMLRMQLRLGLHHEAKDQHRVR